MGAAAIIELVVILLPYVIRIMKELDGEEIQEITTMLEKIPGNEDLKKIFELIKKVS